MAGPVLHFVPNDSIIGNPEFHPFRGCTRLLSRLLSPAEGLESFVVELCHSLRISILILCSEQFRTQVAGVTNAAQRGRDLPEWNHALAWRNAVPTNKNFPWDRLRNVVEVHVFNLSRMDVDRGPRTY